METNIVKTLQMIRQGSINPKEIDKPCRQACVSYLRMEGYSQVEIAEIFQVSRHTIIRDEKDIRKGFASLVDEIDVRAIAGEHIATATQLASKAIRKENYALAWKIKRDLIHDLQNLGYLPKAAEKVDIQLNTFLDLIKLAEKQTKEVKSQQIDANSVNN